MKPPVATVAVVLAAGRGRRFGSDKRCHVIDGTPLLQRTLALPLASGLETLLVLRPEDQLWEEALVGPWYGNRRLRTVFAEHADEGMGCSLAAAVKIIADADAALIMLGDMPYIRSGTLQRLIDAFAPGSIVVPRWRGLTGHPVLFARRWFDELARLEGDRGAKGIIRAHPRRLIHVDVDDPGILRDVDRPAG